MGVKERIKDYCRQSGLKVVDFERAIGVANGYVNSISRGIGPDKRASIIERFPNLNMEWLETGRGSMLIGGDANGDKVCLLPLLPFSAVAGYMSGGNGADSFVGPQVAVPDFTDRGADCTIRVDGDSMFPRYSNGDILAIRILKDPTFFQWGKVYVLSTSQGCVVKKLFPDPEDRNGIICHSENSENYPDYKITKDDVLGVAIVVGHAGVE